MPYIDGSGHKVYVKGPRVSLWEDDEGVVLAINHLRLELKPEDALEVLEALKVWGTDRPPDGWNDNPFKD